MSVYPTHILLTALDGSQVVVNLSEIQTAMQGVRDYHAGGPNPIETLVTLKGGHQFWVKDTPARMIGLNDPGRSDKTMEMKR